MYTYMLHRMAHLLMSVYLSPKTPTTFVDVEGSDEKHSVPLWQALPTDSEIQQAGCRDVRLDYAMLCYGILYSIASGPTVPILHRQAGEMLLKLGENDDDLAEWIRAHSSAWDQVTGHPPLRPC